MTRQPVLTSELLASRVPFEEGLYVVGPFAGRVSFSSQQRRAISLVCDIDRDLQTAGRSGLKQKKVCIVGAGLGGMTSAIVAAALEADVYIYEKSESRPKVASQKGVDRFLPTIRDAVHRDAHPTLNFWPHENVEPFTRLPILNWHEDSCGRVAARIAETLERFFQQRKIMNRIKSVQCGRQVLGLQRSPNNRTWNLQVTSPAKPDEEGPDKFEYDVVILAMGFGAEKRFPEAKTPSYWTAKGDAIPLVVDGACAAIQNYIVSGTGDGGLIEALRLVFKDRRAGNIDEDTMSLLVDAGVQDRVVAAERSVLKVYSDHVLHDDPSVPLDVAKEKIAVQLWAHYKAILDGGLIADGVIAAMEATRSALKNVWLFGRYSHPMELTASPYHRLLTTIAIRKGWLKYRQITSLVPKPTPQVVTVGSGLEAVDITLVDAWACHSAPLSGVGPHNAVKYPDAMLVVRHGYDSPLYDFFQPMADKVERIKKAQHLYADQDALNPEYARKISEALGLPNPTEILKFYDYYRTDIKNYFKERFGLSISLEEREVDDQGTKKRVFKLTDAKVDASRQGSAVPYTLFGVEIENRETPVDPQFDADGYSDD